MAYSEKAYYYETEINGWRWRVEYFPYNLTEGNANRISATYEPTWEQFDTDILFDITSNCESKYSDVLPIGYPTARSIKFTLDIAQMSSEAVQRASLEDHQAALMRPVDSAAAVRGYTPWQ